MTDEYVTEEEEAELKEALATAVATFVARATAKEADDPLERDCQHTSAALDALLEVAATLARNLSMSHGDLASAALDLFDAEIERARQAAGANVIDAAARAHSEGN